jgi:hypothetical protein
MTRKVRIGAGGWQALGLTRSVLLPKYGVVAFAFWGHKVLRWMVPHFYVVGLAANLLLIRTPFFAACLVTQLCGGLVALFAYRDGGRSFPRWTRPITYFYLMNYALAVGFFRFLLRTQRVTWERGVGPSQHASGEAITEVAASETAAFATSGEASSQ